MCDKGGVLYEEENEYEIIDDFEYGWFLGEDYNFFFFEDEIELEEELEEEEEKNFWFDYEFDLVKFELFYSIFIGVWYLLVGVLKFVKYVDDVGKFDLICCCDLDCILLVFFLEFLCLRVLGGILMIIVMFILVFLMFILILYEY